MITLGKRICWGANPEWSTLPILNLPPDTLKVRRRIRNRDAARAFVKTQTEVQEWILAPAGAGLNLEIRQGINARTNTKLTGASPEKP